MWRLTRTETVTATGRPEPQLASRLRLHALAPLSLANGPGRRAVIWFQGCDLGCDGCCNPETRSVTGGFSKSVRSLLSWLDGLSGRIDGVTISGGEPMAQAPGLAALVQGLRRRPDLSVVLFSGKTLARIRRDPHGATILAGVDLLIDGPYHRHAPPGTALAASANQRLHFLSGRIDAAALDGLPVAEMVVDLQGTLHVTGVDGPRLLVPLLRANRPPGQAGV